MSIFEQSFDAKLTLADIRALVVADLHCHAAVDQHNLYGAEESDHSDDSFAVVIDRLSDEGFTRFTLEVSRSMDALITCFLGRVVGSGEIILRRTFESEVGMDDVQVVVEDFLEAIL